LEANTSKRRELLSGAQRAQLLALPTVLREFEERYSFTPSDLEFIGAHRTNSNRLGIAVQLCFLRHPGWAWTPEERIPATMLRWIAAQVSADPSDIESYAKRDPTRREHFLELLQEYSWRSFGLHEYREMSVWLMNQVRSTDLGMALITLLISELRHRRIVVPVLPVLERLTIAARSRARRKAYRALNADLTFEQRLHLDRLLELRGESRQTWLGWLRQAIGAANPNNILACIERLTFIRQLHIPIEWARRIHQNRLVQIAREGAGTDAAHLRSFSPERRYATLAKARLHKRGNRSALLRNMRALGVGQIASGRRSLGFRQPPLQRFRGIPAAA
jgi:Domain of unknown function (DUF4158)